MKRSHEKHNMISLLVANVSVVAAGAALAMSISSFNFLYKDGLFYNDRFALLFALVGTLIAGLVAFVSLQTKRRREDLNKIRRAFVIYSSEDRPLLKELKKTFELAEIEPWIDFEQIMAGEVWGDAINEAISESSMAIVLITKNFNEGTFAYKELNSATKKMTSSDKVTSPIIPLVYDKENLPDSLKHIHYVDMERPDAGEFLVKSLISSMDKLWLDSKVTNSI